MMEVTTVGLDITKHVFQLHGVDQDADAVLRRKLRRAEVVSFFDQRMKVLRTRGPLDRSQHLHFMDDVFLPRGMTPRGSSAAQETFIANAAKLTSEGHDVFHAEGYGFNGETDLAFLTGWPHVMNCEVEPSQAFVQAGRSFKPHSRLCGTQRQFVFPVEAKCRRIPFL